jgi:tryptophan synthase alpha chain
LSDRPLAARWQALRSTGRTALIPYLTAGYPSRDATAAALRMVAEEGADFVELGVPFSDPLADGPVIQRSSHDALAGGMTTAGALELVQAAALDIPVILFTYLNPVLQYGIARFVRDARQVGAAGLLLTDLPAGSDPALEAQLEHAGLDLIRLVAPTTRPERLSAIVRNARGFVYVIARLGVTGATTAITAAVRGVVDAIRKTTTLPIAVGFGIAGAEQARAVAGFADGVVVGSALVRRLADGLEPGARLMRELRGALDRVPVAAGPRSR